MKHKTLAGLAAAAWPAAALAYIDPGTGSLLIQGVIAAIAAIGVTLKLYWHRLIALVRRKPAQPAKQGATAPGSDRSR